MQRPEERVAGGERLGAAGRVARPGRREAEADREHADLPEPRRQQGPQGGPPGGHAAQAGHQEALHGPAEAGHDEEDFEREAVGGDGGAVGGGEAVAGGAVGGGGVVRVVLVGRRLGL